MTTTVYNFSAGPAMLPSSVLQHVQAELLNYQSCGISIMEMSHRDPRFLKIMAHMESSIRTLLNVPDDYSVLFFTAPARAQFSMLPMNLLGDKKAVDYFNTGLWSSVAIAEAKRYANVNIVSDSTSNQFTDIAEPSIWNLNPDAAYCHYTDNESVHGLEFNRVPETGNVPLISDMTSNLFTREFELSRFGMVYAGAQKNIGPAGLTVAIIRDDLLNRASSLTPRSFNYGIMKTEKSIDYTPATFTYYVTSLVLQWLIDQGGVASISQRNTAKSTLLYEFIDNSDFYVNPVTAAYRSRMNVPFMLKEPDLENIFLEQAENAGLLGLKGHRVLGGMRASIYNAMPIEGVTTLIEFMADFAKSRS